MFIFIYFCTSYKNKRPEMATKASSIELWLVTLATSNCLLKELMVVSKHVIAKTN